MVIRMIVLRVAVSLVHWCVSGQDVYHAGRAVGGAREATPCNQWREIVCHSLELTGTRECISWSDMVECPSVREPYWLVREGERGIL